MKPKNILEKMYRCLRQDKTKNAGSLADDVGVFSYQLTLVYLAIWCILVLIYFTAWKSIWFILFSKNGTAFVKTGIRFYK